MGETAARDDNDIIVFKNDMQNKHWLSYSWPAKLSKLQRPWYTKKILPHDRKLYH